PQFQPTMASASDVSSGGRKVALSLDVIANILAATCAMPSWKACQMEGTNWTGTAEENMQTYMSSVGVEEGHLSPRYLPL
ncbi:copper transporter, partial [Moniliophthora roreri MCA 2997]